MIKRIHLGDFSIETLPSKMASVQPDSDSLPYLHALEMLGRALPPGTWALAGGLAVPIAVGRFYRRHTDIDIVMPLTGFAEVVGAFTTKGYELYTSWKISHHSRGVLLQCRIKSSGRVLRMRPRHLYVRHVKGEPDSPLLERIDLYPYRERDGYLETCNSGCRLSERNMQQGSLGPFGRPGSVSCFHLKNIASLKSSRGGAKHELDCTVIRNGPDAAVEWFRNFVATRPAAIPAPAGSGR